MKAWAWMLIELLRHPRRRGVRMEYVWYVLSVSICAWRLFRFDATAFWYAFPKPICGHDIRLQRRM